MPRKSVPAYRLHKASGLARVIIGGKQIHLGKFKIEESRRLSNRLLAKLSDTVPSAPNQCDGPRVTSLFASEVLVAYLRFAESCYEGNGKPSKELQAMKDLSRTLDELYGDLEADQFGPLKLKAFQHHLIE